jgi:hypothetical protein
VKIKSVTYQCLTKAVALFLITGMLLPSAMQARQLVDFCMTEMEMSHHEMMDDSHDCCISDQTDTEGTHKGHHDCEGAQICTCIAEQVSANNQFTIPPAHSAAIILPQNGFNFIVNSPDEFIYEDYYAEARQHSPPLYQSCIHI